MHPINDVMKVEITEDGYNFGLQKKGVENGIVVELPDTLPYFGFHSFAFENSLRPMADHEANELRHLLDFYGKRLMGKRVYWTALAERGMILKEGSKGYVFLKFTDIIAYSDPEIEAQNVHKDGAGGFSV